MLELDDEKISDCLVVTDTFVQLLLLLEALKASPSRCMFEKRPVSRMRHHGRSRLKTAPRISYLFANRSRLKFSENKTH